MHKQFLLGLGIATTGIIILFYFALPETFSEKYTDSKQPVNVVASVALTDSEADTGATQTVTHIPTPTAVKAIYMSSWVAGTPSFRAKLVDIMDTTEINAVVIDIKDYTGRISYPVHTPSLIEFGSVEERIPDLVEFIKTLHDKDIYVIGRIAVFQDPYFITKHPEDAVKKGSDHRVNWKDHKGIAWIDPGSPRAWDYIVSIGQDAYEAGFDELNFDYIRFPSDGNMKDIYYPHSEGKVKHEIMRSFFEHLRTAFNGTGAIISADLFGMTATNTDDLGIGQVLEDALPNFDYIGPMVYPSHFPAGWNNFKSPAHKPYEVIKITMDAAVKRTEAMGLPRDKIRPWLQDFDLGASYTPEMVRAQINATYDAGLTSWMLWDAGNTYTKGALLSN